ncbi:DUF2690 domain-containing protein [Streptomyces sp. ZYX-F-203]
MPRWKALPEELDPQIKEFAGQLRRLVDRNDLSIAALADATGYSRTSWERYLNGRLLAPKGAIVALAEVTGTSPIHLTTLWELAERAWSRSEMRHDMTMEAIRISQARAALGETGGTPRVVPPGSGGGRQAGRGRRGGGTAVSSGRAGVPVQPTAADRDMPTVTAPSVSARSGGAGNSWGVRAPAPAPGRPAEAPGQVPPSAPGGAAGDGSGPPPRVGGRGRGKRSGGRGRVALVAVVAGALAVGAGVFFFLGGSDDEAPVEAAPSARPSAEVTPELPAGVRCSGDGCTGEDAEVMGCGGDRVVTAESVTVGTAVVEVRYSEVCGAAWARVSQAGPGDEVRVAAGGSEQSGTVPAAGGTVAYTPMVAVDGAEDATGCAVLAGGTEGCTA